MILSTKEERTIEEELNTQLYQKMFAKQGQFRTWLLAQPPMKILACHYEHASREER